MKKNLLAYLPVIAPFVFVVLWSSGFVGSRLSAPYADPLTFLAIRMLLAGMLLVPIVYFIKQSYPSTLKDIAHSSVAGILLNACYLGSVFYIVSHHFPIAMTALVMGLQPILGSIIIVLIFKKEHMTGRQWLGMLLGFAGLVLVLVPDFDLGQTNGVSLTNIVICLLGMLGITIGTLYQKYFCAHISIAGGASVQYLASAVVLAVVAFFLEEGNIIWNAQSIFALFWLVVILSMGAVLLFFYLLKNHSSSSVSTLLYSVPALVAVEGYFMFDEVLSLVSVAGMVLTIIGVYMALKKR